MNRSNKEVVSYFSHDSNARNTEKLIRVRMRHNAAGYGVYFMILERLREEPDYMSVKDYNVIAFDLRVDASLIKSVVEDFGLFVFTEDGKYFYSESFSRRMIKKDEIACKRSEAGKLSAASKWGESEQEHNISPSMLRSKRMKMAKEKGTHTVEEWEEMKDFFGECVICGSKDKLVKDHITPIYQNGSDAITNLQPLCSSCNSRKGPDNKDYRIEWCKNRGVMMPNKWLTHGGEMANNKIKEKKNIIPPPKGGGNKKQPEKEISFVPTDFMEAFTLWLDYKKERRQTYKGERSLKILFEKLHKLSGGDPVTALEIVKQSIANNYSGLFPLNEQSNATNRTTHTNTKREANKRAFDVLMQHCREHQEGMDEQVERPF